MDDDLRLGRASAGVCAPASRRSSPSAPTAIRGSPRPMVSSFGRVYDIEAALMYRALAEGEVDVISAYATDGRIEACKLVLLADDRHFFPPYFAVPVVRASVLARHPEVS